mmetsp:Transcript_123725/g.240716  ORF Transcript_123725/g.240716 Transcript_123725/m.240716 type:complete len:222 (+) Transcript_123725:56-721(+)
MARDSSVTVPLCQDPCALDGMNPLQEFSNALTMCVSFGVCAWCWVCWPELRGTRTAAMSLALLIHLPFSCSYHLLLAQRELKDAIDCTPRRLDHTFIFLTSMVFTGALTSSILYTLVGFLLNAYFISRIWAKPEAGVIERMVNVGLAVFLCPGLNALARGDYRNLICGCLWFITGAAAMVQRLGGWGHSIMHVCLGGLTYHCLVSASELQKSEPPWTVNYW